MISASRLLTAMPASTQKPCTLEAVKDESLHEWQILVENTGFAVSSLGTEKHCTNRHFDTWEGVQRYLQGFSS